MTASSAITRAKAPPSEMGGRRFYFDAGIALFAVLLAIKGAKWLRGAVPVDASAGSISSVRAFLSSGASSDNVVDSTNFGLRIRAFNSDASLPGTG